MDRHSLHRLELSPRLVYPPREPVGYIQFDFDLNESFNLQAGAYFHRNEGRGHRLPPFLTDLIDGGSAGQSELLGSSTAYGGTELGEILYVDGNGDALSPNERCTTSFISEGKPAPEYGPNCYPVGAIAAMSCRHTHYHKERTGLTLEFSYNSLIAGHENELRGGLWYENVTRTEHRDWHKISAATQGDGFDATPYWVQYDRSHPQETQKWYLQGSLTINPLTLTSGAKQFFVDVERKDLFHESADASINSDSDRLVSAGLLGETPLEGMELFASYAETLRG